MNSDSDSKGRSDPAGIIERCLEAFIAAGTLDLSLDQLAAKVGVSKRMLIHYFGTREGLEIRATELLEERLRASFVPAAFPAGTSARTVVNAIWARSTAPASRGIMQLIMDLSRRGWSGSERARTFYVEQQNMWLDLLNRFIPKAADAEELLLLFQGAVLFYLVTGDHKQGSRTLNRLLDRI